MIENIRLSFQGIWAHKMRSFLTMLGIIIGIAAIIAIVSTIKGTSEQIKNNLVGEGNNTVSVALYQGDWEYVEGEGGTISGTPVMSDDIIDELEAIEEVKKASAYFMARSYGEIFYKKTVLDGTSVIGTDGRYFDVNSYVIKQGRGFVESDFEKFAKVAIVDSDAVESLFQGEEPLGKTIEIKGEPFVIVGVVTKNTKFEPVINNMEDWYTYYSEYTTGRIFVPDTIWPVIYSFDAPFQVSLQATTTENMTAAGKKAADILNGYITTSGDEEMSVKYKSDNVLEKAKALQEVSASTNKQLIWIASISLLVGGIGVMNIMLVSVTERTREIGLKKALGARKKVILGQFLTEAAVLTSLGGIIGVGAGIALAYLISKVAAVPVAISGPAILVSVIFSMIIGIVFGLLPSFKAAKLNPIDALRYE